jgi:hypothetical protein
MNITHTKISAASGENFCGYSLVRRIAAGCLIACAAMTTAVAGPGDKDRERGAQMQRDAIRSERMQAPRQDARQYDDRRQFDARSFEQRAEDQRRNLQAQEERSNQNAEAFRRSGRLTPDERRDLRRQINEAGMDFYPSRPRR